MAVWVFSGVEKCLTSLTKEIFHINPLCWRDEERSTRFPNIAAKHDLVLYEIMDNSKKCLCITFGLGSLALDSEIFRQKEIFMMCKE